MNDFEREERVRELKLKRLVANLENSQEERDQANAELEKINERKRRRAEKRKPGW